MPLSATAHFAAYSREGFGLEAQERLATLAAVLAAVLAAQAIPVLISNHATPVTCALDASAMQIEAFPVRRHSSEAGDSRGDVMEVLALFSSRGS